MSHTVPGGTVPGGPTAPAPTGRIAQTTPVGPSAAAVSGAPGAQGASGSPEVPGAPVPERRSVIGESPATTLTCPECGTQTTVTLSRRDAQDFCPSCDYPMFWARPEQAAGRPDAGGDDARRRLPGASGATQLATVPCPSCGELNLPGAWLCIRCESSMVVAPPPEPEPVPMPVPVVEPEPMRFPEATREFPLWWFAAMIAVGALWWGLSLIF